MAAATTIDKLKRLGKNNWKPCKKLVSIEKEKLIKTKYTQI